MLNEGIGVSLGYRGNLGNDLSFSVDLNGSHYKNQIVRIAGNQNFFYGFSRGRGSNNTINQLGNFVGAFYGYVADGIFANQQEVDEHVDQDGAAPGRIRFKDVNGDGTILADDKDSYRMKIVNYFEQQAPEALLPAEPPVALVTDQNSMFSVEKPAVADFAAPTAVTTMVKLDPQTDAIFTSDANENALIKWHADFNAKTVLSMASPAVDLNFIDDADQQNKTVLTTIGTMLAEDISRGIVQYVSMENDTAITRKKIGSELTRPLQARSADFNKDGLQDWIICEFGHKTGGLYLHQQQTDTSYQRKTLRGLPGAEDVAIDDFNGDGWPDLMALFAYDDEGIWLFINDKEGSFEMENVLRFPPVFGSTSFERVDMNGDSRKDIVLTNGDNADFSPILKPYHGLRIYLNKGKNKYEEAYFYPINGTFKAVVQDFDLDGDQDIATIAFFADLKNNPEESFILFKQTSPEGLSFKPVAVPVHQYGRWLSMDAGDIDGDGDIDLLLGNFSRRFIGYVDFNPTWNTKVPFILLNNNTR